MKTLQDREAIARQLWKTCGMQVASGEDEKSTRTSTAFSEVVSISITPGMSGASQKACDIANAICDLDGFANVRGDLTFWASVARVISGELQK